MLQSFYCGTLKSNTGIAILLCTDLHTQLSILEEFDNYWHDSIRKKYSSTLAVGKDTNIASAFCP